MRANVVALNEHDDGDTILERYGEIARLVTANAAARIDDGIQSIAQLCRDLRIPALSSYGITPDDIPAIVEKSAVASSMKANPIALDADILASILKAAL